MAGVNVVWNMKALAQAAATCEDARKACEQVVVRWTDSANKMAEDPTGTRYGGYPDGGILDHPSAPRYEGDVRMGRSGYAWVGIVHPANGAAYADMAKNNTLLKAMG